MGSIAYDSVVGFIGLIGVPGFIGLLLLAGIGAAFDKKGNKS